MNSVDHAAVYAAELAAFDGTDLEVMQPFEVVEARMRAVVEGAWWPGGGVRVRRARADASSSATRCRGDEGGRTSTISLSAPQLTIATAAHELAHALAGADRGHDALYRRAYLDIVQVMTNLDSTDRRHELHVTQLSDAFAAAGLPVADRAWAAPPETAGGAFAL